MMIKNSFASILFLVLLRKLRLLINPFSSAILPEDLTLFQVVINLYYRLM